MAEEKYIGFCVKCKKKQEIKDPQVVTIKGKGGKRDRLLQEFVLFVGQRCLRF